MNTISKLLIYTFLILGFQILVLLSKSKTEIVTNSIEERYLRSDQIGPKFTKAYKKLNLRYEWLNDGIIIKNTEGESNLDTFIDGNTGESRILKGKLLQAKQLSLFHSNQLRVGNLAPLVLIKLILSLKINLVEKSEFFG